MINKVKPKKFFGQHFIPELSVAERITDHLDAYKNLTVLELGLGMGVLTQFLFE